MPVKTKPLAWATWESPDRVAVRPDMKNETGDTLPRLLLIPLANGALKITATRRPLTMLSVAAGTARAMHTWIDSALVSEPEVKLGQVAQVLSKRLRLAGHRYIGGGTFENLPVETAVAMLTGIRDIAELPPKPAQPVIPTFLRKETSMPSPSAHPIHRPADDGLIPVLAGEIGGVPCNVCDARTLHAFLEVGKDFTTWIKDRIEKYGFLENQDFALLSQNCEQPTDRFSPNLGKTPKGGRPTSDYHLALDMAKELSMVENNEKGRQARRYFIECERRAQGALAGNSGTELPPMIDEAIEFRTWRLADEYRSTTMSLLGEPTTSDQEVLWDMSYRVKKHARTNLTKHAMQLLTGKMDVQAISAWILAWKPEVAERDRRLY